MTLKHLFLSVSPRVSSPARTEIHEFESKTVVCTATANPAPVSSDYKWFNPEGYQNSSSSELTITRATKKDAGRYTCHISVRSNDYGLLNSTSHTTVTVLCKLFTLHCFGEYNIIAAGQKNQQSVTYTISLGD